MKCGKKGDREGVEGGEEEKPRAILICTHAATMIAAGRALTGRMPEDFTEDDFGISKHSEFAEGIPSYHLYQRSNLGVYSMLRYVPPPSHPSTMRWIPLIKKF